MEENLKVNKETYKALIDVLKNKDKETVLKIHSYNEKWTGTWEPLNNLSVMELAQALLIGFEVEESKEEIILKAYELCKHSESYREGVRLVLKVYGITIKGIN